MGICISSASSKILESEICHENVVYCEKTLASDGTQRLDSLHSHQGSKGSNQDAAILHKGYGIEDGAFCGVFDGHGISGHVVSKLVRDRLPMLLLNQKDALTKINTVENANSLLNNGERAEGEMATNEDFCKWRKACVSAFKVMDKEIKLVESLDCSCSGTTAVVVIRQGEDLIIANLGDSRAVLGTISEEGELKAVQLTTDLKPDLAMEAERIRKSDGRVLALKGSHTFRGCGCLIRTPLDLPCPELLEISCSRTTELFLSQTSRITGSLLMISFLFLPLMGCGMC
ncbi:Phosphoprotein phosphatase [Bertholletia excelsa]